MKYTEGETQSVKKKKKRLGESSPLLPVRDGVYGPT